MIYVSGKKSWVFLTKFFCKRIHFSPANFKLVHLFKFLHLTKLFRNFFYLEKKILKYSEDNSDSNSIKYLYLHTHIGISLFIEHQKVKLHYNVKN